MTAVNPDSAIDVQLQNWDNFCKYHTGNWYGIWTVYNSEGETIDSFRCVRSFHLSADGSKINHQNHYTYADGKTKSEAYGPYKKPITRALFLENSFSWGSSTVKSGLAFFFETGFRHEDRRANAIASYDESGRLQNILIVPEFLGSFVEKPPHSPTIELKDQWQGTFKIMTPDLIISSEAATIWNRLEDLREDYLKLDFPNGISVSLPRFIESKMEFFLTVDWLTKPTLLQRGTRYFDLSGFTTFSLQTFSLIL